MKIMIKKAELALFAAFWLPVVLGLDAAHPESVIDLDEEPIKPKKTSGELKDEYVLTACNELEDKYGSGGFVTEENRNFICENNCNLTFTVDCDEEERSEFDMTSKEVFDKLEDWAGQLVTEDIAMGADADLVTADLLSVWGHMNRNGAGLVLAVIPIALNQWKYYKYWHAVGLSVLYMILHLFSFTPTAITIHNIGMAGLCALLPAGSHVLTEGIVALFVELNLLYAAFNNDPAVQIIIFILAVMGYFWYIYWCFYIRRQGATGGVVIIMLQTAVMVERVQYARSRFALDSFAQVAIEMACNAVFPYGPYRYFGKNAAVLGVRVIRYIGIEDNRSGQLATLVAIQVFMMIAFRAGMGAFYIHTLRYKLDAVSGVRGLWVYMIDFFGPMRVVWRLVFKYEPMTSRRMMYACVGLALFWSEQHNAAGLFSLRFFLSLLDIMILKTPEGKAMHYLEFNVDFQNLAFPQKSAPPYFSIAKINDAAQKVVMVFATQSDKTVRGLGVLLRSGGSVLLYSVRHVVKGAKSVKFGDDNVSSPDFRPVSTGSDPVVAMKYSGDDVPDIDLITADEAYDVKQLVFANCSVNSKYEITDRLICVVPNFGITGGRLYATVNLKKGDSGGPCFAILSDGAIRFCGVVSQGNPRQGGGNIVSFCYADPELGANSSDDESNGHGRNVRQFNRIRRIGFASEKENAEGFRHGAASRLNEWLNTNDKTWTYAFDNHGKFLEWDDVGDPAQAANDFHAHIVERDRIRGEELRGDGRETERGDDDGGWRDDDVGPGKNRNYRRRDAKRRNKDKAAQKRDHYNHAMVCHSLRENLIQVYSEIDAKNIYKAVLLSGDVPQLDARTFISGTNGYDFVVDEDLPDPAWT